MTYYDTQLQLAYAQAAARYSDPAFLAEIQMALDAEWQLLQSAVASEVSLSPPWEGLATRQALLHRSLNPAQPVLAYSDPIAATTATSILVFVANPLNLPVEIVGFDVDGATFLEIDPAWLTDGSALVTNALPGVVLSAHAGGEMVPLRYVHVALPLPTAVAQDAELTGHFDPEIWVATRVAGSDAIVYTIVQSGVPLPLSSDNLEATDGTE
jgi:hypothetical protein